MLRLRLASLLPALLSSFLVALLVAPVAQAAPAKMTRKKAMWGPARVDGRSQFKLYRELGVGIWQSTLVWSNIAPRRPENPRDPDDPAYAWPADVDFGYREAGRHGMRVLLMAIRTPSWANGGKDGRHPPGDVRDYADFLEAAARRYPAVRHWMVWGEPHRHPNYELPLTPPGRDVREGLDDNQKSVVRGYAKLVDASYVRLKRLSRRNLVIGGNTTTSGDLTPFDWIRNMTLDNGRPPRMDMVGHNPFGTREPDLRKNQIEYGTADFSDLDLFMGWVDRYLSRKGSRRRLPIFISEWNAPTKSGYEFNYHVTPRTQAKWIRTALRLTRRTRRIYTLGWHSLYDLGPRADGQYSYTGLLSSSGRRKPGFYAFKRN
jgi:hypothetical protein